MGCSVERCFMGCNMDRCIYGMESCFSGSYPHFLNMNGHLFLDLEMFCYDFVD